MGILQRLFGGRPRADVSTSKPIDKRPQPPRSALKPEQQGKHYSREQMQAAAAGKTVKQLRAGVLGTAETKAALEALKDAEDKLPTFRIRASNKGLAIALPDGRVIDPTSIHLRHWHIFGCKIMGTSYYKAGSAQRRDGQQLSLKREPKNEHDPNAVAVMTRSGSSKIGYVAKGQARRVAKAVDSGIELVAYTMMGGSQVLITTPETWSAINR